jgi:hypothetical protein
MDIKRTGPNNPAWPTPESGKTGASKPAETQAGDAGSASSAMDAAFASIQTGYKRADLHTEKWPAILQQSAAALVSKSAGQFGALPDADKQKIANLIAGDPILSNKIFRYLDQHLA